MASVGENDNDLQENALLRGGENKNSTDDDDLLLLSSPSPSPKQSHKTKASTSKRKAKTGPSAHAEVVDLDDDLDLEILEEVTSIPGAHLSASDSVSSGESEEGIMEEDDEDDSDQSTSFVEGKINIFYSHGSFFIWNADDVQMIREECRIVGKLAGCLPRAPRQNIQLGLPLQLMPEEAKLLLDIDAAAVVIDKSVSDTQQQARKAAFENVRQQNSQIQQGLYKKHRKEEVSQRMESIIAGKKAKKRKLKEESKNTTQASEGVKGKEDLSTEALSQDKNSSKSDDFSTETKDKNCSKSDDFSTETKDKNSSKSEEDEDIDSLTVDDIVTTETSEAHSLVQIFTENPWKQTITSFHEWSYPSTERDVLRYMVFKDLWGKGFYLTSGSKFGGDFLVYPGDPARYHSHYIAICRSQFDETPCLDLVSLGRLASNVRKTALLCSLDRNRKVLYTSLTWTGIS